MCSIYGAIGPSVNEKILDTIRSAARDRGRDGGRLMAYPLGARNVAHLGNWRATPTTEVQSGKLQPYGGLVHNGTIANDEELGAKPGEIDSEVLARVLDRTNLMAFASSLERVKGSYAVAAVNESTVLAAVNYKPLFYFSDNRGNIYFSSMERHFHNVVPFGMAPVQVQPYSAIDFLTGQTIDLPRKNQKRAVVVCSAGLDSTVVATIAAREGYEVTLVHFRYGCLAESKESQLIPLIAARLGCDYEFLHLPAYPKHASKLFGKADEISSGVLGAEFAHEWVPARNLLMMAAAVAYAESNGYHVVALGNNLEESGAYPDNEEQLSVMFDALLPYAVQNGYEMRLAYPVGNLMKHEIVKRGVELNAPLDLTWSCYKAGERHCGVCSPCYMRRVAFERSGLKDPVFA